MAEIGREFDGMMLDREKIAAQIMREERFAKALAEIEAPHTQAVPVVEGRTAPAVYNGLTMD